MALAEDDGRLRRLVGPVRRAQERRGGPLRALRSIHRITAYGTRYAESAERRLLLRPDPVGSPVRGTVVFTACGFLRRREEDDRTVLAPRDRGRPEPCLVRRSRRQTPSLGEPDHTGVHRRGRS